MSRPIKFRAWDEDGEMIPVTDLHFREDGSVVIYQEDDKGQLIFGADGSAVSLMQFTGLLDKNGKEIYEGDIVEFERPEIDYQFDGPMRTLSEVLNQDTLVEVLRAADAIKDGEVIGNIYENKELLK